MLRKKLVDNRQWLKLNDLIKFIYLSSFCPFFSIFTVKLQSHVNAACFPQLTFTSARIIPVYSCFVSNQDHVVFVIHLLLLCYSQSAQHSLSSLVIAFCQTPAASLEVFLVLRLIEIIIVHPQFRNQLRELVYVVCNQRQQELSKDF